jgi:hypothetical protein
MYPEYRKARQPDGCRVLFAYLGDAGEALAKSIMPGFKFALAEIRRP